MGRIHSELWFAVSAVFNWFYTFCNITTKSQIGLLVNTDT